MDEEDIKQVEDTIISFSDDLVSKGDIEPEDAFFVFGLFRYYYASYNSLKNPVSCEFAWDVANFISEVVDENPEFGWFNAYSITSDMKSGFWRDLHPAEEIKESQAPTSKTPDLDEGAGSMQPMKSLIMDITNQIELYIDMDEEMEPLTIEKRLETFFNAGQSRYAGFFGDDVLESKISMESYKIIKEYQERDDLSKYDMLQGLEMVNEWVKWKAH